MTYGLTNRQYAEVLPTPLLASTHALTPLAVQVCEILGTAAPMEFAAQATNTTSPDTGNMEVLIKYGTEEQREKWLTPLLNGEIR